MKQAETTLETARIQRGNIGDEGRMALKENKRYYWLQLKEDFFTSKEMKLLRRLPGGNEHTIIYLKIMLASLQDSGKIYFEHLGNDLAEEIALLIDEDIEAVRMTLLFLTNKQLLTTKDKFEFQLEQVPELIGSETASTRRSRKFRERQKALQCNTDATERNGEIEIDIEKEIEIEKEQEKDVRSTYKMFEDEYGRLLSSSQSETVLKLLEENSADLVQEALKRSVLNGKTKRGTLNLAYIEGILRNWQLDNVQSVSDIHKPKPNYSTAHYKHSNIPDWSSEEVKNEQTAEGQAKLAELFAELEAMEGADD